MAPDRREVLRLLRPVSRVPKSRPDGAFHRRRFFFTPTGTCARPPPGVKIFLVSSYCAHTPRVTQNLRIAPRIANSSEHDIRRGECPANVPGVMLPIHADRRVPKLLWSAVACRR